MVKIYTKSRCPNCVKSVNLMKRLEIPYEEISLETTPGALDTVISMGFQAAPVIVTEEESWSGFKDSKIRGLASLEGVW